MHTGTQGFCVCLFGLFTDSILYVFQHTLRDRLTPAVLRAWTALITYICAKLQEGFGGAAECTHNNNAQGKCTHDAHTSCGGKCTHDAHTSCGGKCTHDAHTYV